MKLGIVLSVALLLSLGYAQAVAQSGPLPLVTNQELTDQAQSAAALRAEIRAEIAQIRANAKANAATREQIQQLRMALKAKLSALRH
jgi:hypothetical protein